MLGLVPSQVSVLLTIPLTDDVAAITPVPEQLVGVTVGLLGFPKVPPVVFSVLVAVNTEALPSALVEVLLNKETWLLVPV